MKKQPNFNVEDIKKVCKVILDNPIQERYDETRCIYCHRYQRTEKEEHENDCPVLIARDVITGL